MSNDNMNEPSDADMNLLQGEAEFDGRAPISDNCVTWADVAQGDREGALMWLKLKRISQAAQQKQTARGTHVSPDRLLL